MDEKAKITRAMTIEEVVDRYPQTVLVVNKHGFLCGLPCGRPGDSGTGGRSPRHPFGRGLGAGPEPGSRIGPMFGRRLINQIERAI